MASPPATATTSMASDHQGLADGEMVEVDKQAQRVGSPLQRVDRVRQRSNTPPKSMSGSSSSGATAEGAATKEAGEHFDGNPLDNSLPDIPASEEPYHHDPDDNDPSEVELDANSNAMPESPSLQADAAADWDTPPASRHQLDEQKAYQFTDNASALATAPHVTALAAGNSNRPALKSFLNNASNKFQQLKFKVNQAKTGSAAVSGSGQSLSTRSPFASNSTIPGGCVFGKALSEVALCLDNGLPSVVVDMVDYLTKNCLDLEGIFRVPGSQTEIRAIRLMYDNGAAQVDFNDLDICKTPHTVSALLKLYFRELPEPLLTFELYDCFIAANGIVVPEARLECIKKILAMVPAQHLNLLVYLVRFLHQVSLHSAENKMNAANLAMVFAPNLLRSADSDLSITVADTPHASQMLQSMISEFDYFFGDFTPLPIERSVEVDETDALAAPSESELNLPSSPTRPRRSKHENRTVHNVTTHFRALNAKLKNSVAARHHHDDTHSQGTMSTMGASVNIITPVVGGTTSSEPRALGSFTSPSPREVTDNSVEESRRIASRTDRSPRPVGPRPNPFLADGQWEAARVSVDSSTSNE